MVDSTITPSFAESEPSDNDLAATLNRIAQFMPHPAQQASVRAGASAIMRLTLSLAETRRMLSEADALIANSRVVLDDDDPKHFYKHYRTEARARHTCRTAGKP